ncbi:two-component system sensor histidine kinase DesK [Nonomuraea thailandensis]|uniref:Two-component system sensor histidine kinase DesK n=1 Tax=Nonomuraea thailandensis TaxID=1188745 RepID=A0A9X2GQ74_9ACTN|nr:histidine kinase [Nonomuraea thailandensis]MCP2361369.1 two-component system sensor histidine kinase DesK [Nonomuraea thailandensis]
MNEIERARRYTWHVLVSGIAATWVVIAISIGVRLEEGLLDWWRIGPALIAAIGFTSLCPRIIRAVLDRRYPTSLVVVAAVLALAAAVLGGPDPAAWGFVIVAWLSIATLHITRRASLMVALGTWLACVGASAATWQDNLFARGLELTFQEALFVNTLIYGVFCVVVPPSNRLWVWIWMLAEEAHKGRAAHTKLALAEERLRFARDLHDLVGHQLSAIAVKTELAVRLSDVDGDAAKAEMAEVNTLTRKALKELRQAVRGYRELDLAAEVNSVKGVLEAAGVRCEVRLPYRDLPPGVAPVFAYAVREAVTNVLKHSTATFCEITIRFTEQEAELGVRNDGVARRQAVDLGSGLAGMGERLAAVGGKLAAHPTGDGQFLLTAVVSLPLTG